MAYSRRYHYPNAWADNGKNYSLMQHVEDLAAFIRALNVGKVHLVGGSYGARVAVYTALKYPELLRSLVISEPSLIFLETSDAKTAIAEWNREVGRAAAAAKAGDAKQAAILLFDAVSGETRAFQKATVARQQRWLDNANTIGLMYGDAPPGVSCEQLLAIKLPMLVMQGEKSRRYFAQGVEKLLSCLPDGTSRAVVPNAPHMWYAVNPRPGAEVILDFIAKLSAVARN